MPASPKNSPFGKIRYEIALKGVWHDYANIFPEIAPEAQKALKEDIRRHGVHDPIVVFENQILDGRNRYMAARDLGVEFPVVDFLGDREAALDYVISTNLHRRHLNESQRASIAAKISEMTVGRPPKQNSANLHNFDETQDSTSALSQTLAEYDLELPLSGEQVAMSQHRAADMLNVSPRNVAKARKVQAKGIPELGAAVDKGDLSLNAAEKIAVLPEVEQKAAAELGVAGFKAKAKKASKPKPVKTPQADTGSGGRSRQALEDELADLRDENRELRDLHERQQREITELKDRIEELTAGDSGAVIGSLQAQLASAKAARDKAMEDAKGMERRLKNVHRERDEAIAALDAAIKDIAMRGDTP